MKTKFKVFNVVWIQDNEEVSATLYAKSEEEIKRIFAAYVVVLIELA